MTTDAMAVRREQDGERGAFYIDGSDGRLAELIFSMKRDGKVAVLEHTEVDESLRGQGIARTLVHAAVAWARGQHLRLVPVCPFARAVFTREPDLGDVLEK